MIWFAMIVAMMGAAKMGDSQMRKIMEQEKEKRKTGGVNLSRRVKSKSGVQHNPIIGLAEINRCCDEFFASRGQEKRDWMGGWYEKR